MKTDNGLVEVEADEAPGVVAFPILQLPDLLTGETPWASAVRIVGALAVPTTEDGADRQAALKERFGTGVANAWSEIPLTPFAQVLAHIGHGFLSSLDCADDHESLLLPIARGDHSTTSAVIGGLPMHFEIPPPKWTWPHQIQPYNVRAGGVDYLTAVIRLFVYLEPMPPAYLVVLCRRTIPNGESYLSFVRDKRTHTVNVEGPFVVS